MNQGDSFLKSHALRKAVKVPKTSHKETTVLFNEMFIQSYTTNSLSDFIQWKSVNALPPFSPLFGKEEKIARAYNIKFIIFFYPIKSKTILIFYHYLFCKAKLFYQKYIETLKLMPGRSMYVQI